MSVICVDSVSHFCSGKNGECDCYNPLLIHLLKSFVDLHRISCSVSCLGENMCNSNLTRHICCSLLYLQCLDRNTECSQLTCQRIKCAKVNRNELCISCHGGIPAAECMSLHDLLHHGC